MRRESRVVTVCLDGRQALRLGDSMARVALVRDVIVALRDRPAWLPLDAVLFPGGFLRLKRFIGGLSADERLASIGAEKCMPAIIELARRLSDYSPGTLMVLGGDVNDRTIGEDEHFCIALDGFGLVNVVRKIFPTDLDTRLCRRPVVPIVTDYDAGRRVITLPNGATALLGACYDLFGIAERPETPTLRTRTIRYLHDEQWRLDLTWPEFFELRRQCIVRWARSLAETRPTVALGCIHDFKRPGLDSYWQRHGIAMASAGLAGGLVVGAAHFIERLPGIHESSLAASGVPARHLTLGAHRPSRRLKAIDGFYLERQGGPDTLVRLFTSKGTYHEQ